jgi:predicted TIM-barrel fold metal-dependent hydrolase
MDEAGRAQGPPSGDAGPGPGGDLRLVDYRPRQALRIPQHPVERPRFPVIDAHNHLGPEFGGGWAARPVSELLEAMDAAGVEAMVDADGGWGARLDAEVDRWQAPHPDRFHVFANVDDARWADDPDFGRTEARRLRDSAARGARGLKVWKTVGLRSRDPDGRLVMPDDERLDELWAAAGELGLPVLIHVADPVAFFEPLDATNERWEELAAHPDWHFWPTRPVEDRDASGFPPFDALIDSLDRVLGRHPHTTFLGAHVGCAAEDLARVDAMLVAHDNYVVDIAARLGELGRQPYTARAFFLRWPDRILFGTDVPGDPALYRVYYRFLETRDESFPYDLDEPPGQGRWRIHGLGLPDAVLEQVYRANARRLLGLQ